MANDFSHLDDDAPFVDERDARFEQLLNNREFWKAAVENTSLASRLSPEEIEAVYVQLATDGSRIFDLVFKQNLPIEDVVRREFGRGWSKKYVRLAIFLITMVRAVWEKGGMCFSYETYAPRLQEILQKAERGIALTSTERAKLVANVGMRLREGLPLHPLQRKIFNKEMHGLTATEGRKKFKQMMLDALGE